MVSILFGLCISTHYPVLIHINGHENHHEYALENGLQSFIVCGYEIGFQYFIVCGYENGLQYFIVCGYENGLQYFIVCGYENGLK